MLNDDFSQKKTYSSIHFLILLEKFYIEKSLKSGNIPAIDKIFPKNLN